MGLNQQVIGLVPAGGKATRIAPLPFSKELFPVGFHPIGEDGSLRPKVVSQYLLEKFRRASIRKAYVILREGKWDIPTYFGDGKGVGLHLAYLMMDLPYGVPFTLDQAYPFIDQSIVALGFPDIIIHPEDAFATLLSKLEETGVDIVVGLFPARQPHKTDMVEVDSKGKVLRIHVKPAQTDLSYSWEIAVWTPKFTHYMHEFVSSHTITWQTGQEVHVADVFQAAIQDGLEIESVFFTKGECLDIGTPEDLLKAVQEKCVN